MFAHSRSTGANKKSEITGTHHIRGSPALEKVILLFTKIAICWGMVLKQSRQHPGYKYSSEPHYIHHKIHKHVLYKPCVKSHDK